MPVLVGCCGWAGARWKYFEDFPVVELQTTFYQPPSVALAEKWRAVAPADFVFALKAWQLITHPASSPTYRRLRRPVPPEQRDRYGFFRPTGEVWEAWLTTRAIARALRAAVIVFECPASFTPPRRTAPTWHLRPACRGLRDVQQRSHARRCPPVRQFTTIGSP